MFTLHSEDSCRYQLAFIKHKPDALAPLEAIGDFIFVISEAIEPFHLKRVADNFVVEFFVAS